MNKLEFKKEVLNAAIEQHQSVIQDYKTRIDDLRESVAAINEDEEDLQEYSLGNEINEKINRLADQLQFANEEMRTLDRMKVGDKPNEEVALGSVVVTDQHTFYVSASIERFHADGKVILGLSTKSPLYQEMQGKKIGEKFMYKDTIYTILDIY